MAVDPDFAASRLFCWSALSREEPSLKTGKTSATAKKPAPKKSPPIAAKKAKPAAKSIAPPKAAKPSKKPEVVKAEVAKGAASRKIVAAKAPAGKIAAAQKSGNGKSGPSTRVVEAPPVNGEAVVAVAAPPPIDLIPPLGYVERRPMPKLPTSRNRVQKKPDPPTKLHLGKMTYTFEEGGAELRDILGGKGAGLGEMTRIGLPVPPGFTITTEVCRRYMELGRQFPPGLEEEIHRRIAELERKTGKEFGGETNPLLVSVRSGARVSMPGMMDTVLNLGLNNRTCNALVVLTKNDKFAWDAYRRFVQMFATVVLGMKRDPFEEVIERYVAKARIASDSELTALAFRNMTSEFKALVRHYTKKDFPEDVYSQLRMAVDAVFNSWNSKRAQEYRKHERIPDWWGTAVNVVTMVFGNMGEDSGTGVAFTRNPSTGEKKLYGEFLPNAQGEDVVSGSRTPMKITELDRRNPKLFKQFNEYASLLEKHYHDMQDIEFTVERGRLYILQCRSGKRSAAAAIQIAADMVKEHHITREEAVMRIDPASIQALLHAQLDDKIKIKPVTRGLNASPGAAAGVVVFEPDTAVEYKRQNKRCVLVRPMTAPDDVHGMYAAEGILTSQGGATSHAAVVARGMGKPAVVGCEAILIDLRARQFAIKGTNIIVHEGDPITIDGTTGNVYLEELPMQAAKMSGQFQHLLQWADEYKRLGVWANADTPEDAQKARDFGAEGIGLCRTEHMFMQQERLPVVQEMIMAETPDSRRKCLEQLLPMQRDDFKGILKAMKGLPVTIRLLDPPLHEFLPSLEDLLVETTELRVSKSDPSLLAKKDKILRRVRALHENNPMLGLRVCRLGIVYPEIYQMQVRAIVEAAVELRKEKIDARPFIMIPGVGTVTEMIAVRGLVVKEAERIIKEGGVKLPYQVGTMIELPRACLVAHRIADHAEFFSFGTNDLTQTVFGYSRDDAEGTFIPAYLEKKILREDPFQVIDQDGVGEMMRMAMERGRMTRPDLKIGICGEHGGDPSSVAFCHDLGLDYVSCSPFRVPVARLAASQVVLRERAAAEKGAKKKEQD
jgi:pyruvate,orthophosphate dikinase